MSDFDIPEADDFGPFHVEHLEDSAAVYDSYVARFTMYYPEERLARAAARALQAAAAVGHDELVTTYELLRDRPCECSGPRGWHCEGEDSQHWAKGEDPTAECGHCGWSPES